MTDPAPRLAVEHRLAAADAAARHPGLLERSLASVPTMTSDRWDSLAIEELTEAEANAFWQAIIE